MRVLIFGACLLALLAGCTGSLKPNAATRLDTPLVVRDFNDASDQYAARPTFVSLVERYQTGMMLSIKVDLYGTNAHLYIPEQSVAELLPLIDKYLEWEALAMERGDQLQKEIGAAPGWGAFKLNLLFFSGAMGSHFLVVRQCALGCFGGEGDYSFYFDREGAQQLRDLAVDLRDGNLKMLDVDKVYN